ncbi:MAG TPA: GerMN domain-containing protein [Spirochaetota bacterium]|nr:GerMN domain-containing protein [Spirochaetota bacterium]
MAVKKGTGSTGKKKKSAAGKKSAPKAPARRAAAPPAQRGSRALYLLVILALLTVIVYMANMVFFQDRAPKRLADDGQRDAKRAEQTKQDQKKADERDDRKKDDGKAQSEQMVKIYLVRVDDNTGKSSMIAVSRSVKGQPTVQQALAELVRGSTAAEKRRGLLTAIPPSLRVRSVTVKNRSAEIDFNGAIEQPVGKDIMINRIDQIVYTATDIPGVDSVLIRINGRRQQTLGGEGIPIAGPLRRRQ